MKTIFYIFLVFTTIVSCKEQTPKTKITEIKLKNQIQPKNDSVKEKPKAVEEIKFMKVDMESFPVSEDTSFDIYDKSYRENHPVTRVYTKLKNEEIHKLGLQDWLKNGTNISVNYELPYSDIFRTFVFTFQDGEMELKTFMVTFDKNFKKIDELQIAYDEIAESWMRTKSEITKDKIEVIEHNESSGEAEITTTLYKINKKGKFIMISKNKPTN